jgi:hypothetical protein
MSTTQELISEAAVLKRWPLLSKHQLRAARKAGRISWIKGKRGSAWYRAIFVENFIAQELECLAQESDPYLKSAASGSLKNPDDLVSTVSGMIPEMEELASQASAQRILKSQGNGSQRLLSTDGKKRTIATSP